MRRVSVILDSTPFAFPYQSFSNSSWLYPPNIPRVVTAFHYRHLSPKLVSTRANFLVFLLLLSNAFQTPFTLVKAAKWILIWYRSDHVISLLRSFPWLPIGCRMPFTHLTEACESLHGLALTSVSNLISYYLHSSHIGVLFLPQMHKAHFRLYAYSSLVLEHYFLFCANCLPLVIQVSVQIPLLGRGLP